MADDGAIVVYRGLNNQSEGIINHHDSRSDNMAVSATVTATYAPLHRMGEGLIKRLVISSVFNFRTKLHLRGRKSHRAPLINTSQLWNVPPRSQTKMHIFRGTNKPGS